MGKYDHLWNDYWCLDIKSNKKKQIYKDTRYQTVNSAGSYKDLHNREFLIQRQYLKTEHVRCFVEEGKFKGLKQNFSSRKWLMKHFGIRAYTPFTAKSIDKVHNAFKIDIYDTDHFKFDSNIDGKNNKFIQSDFFHIKIIYSGKLKTHERTFKKVKNISKQKGKIKFKGLEFPPSPYDVKSSSWIFLSGVEISEFTFTQDLGQGINELGGEIKHLGSEIKSEMKEIFGSLNPFKKKKKKKR